MRKVLRRGFDWLRCFCFHRADWRRRYDTNYWRRVPGSVEHVPYECRLCCRTWEKVEEV